VALQDRQKQADHQLPVEGALHVELLSEKKKHFDIQGITVTLTSHYLYSYYLLPYIYPGWIKILEE